MLLRFFITQTDIGNVTFSILRLIVVVPMNCSGVLSGPDNWYLLDGLIIVFLSIRSGRMQFMLAPESMVTSMSSLFKLAIIYNALAFLFLLIMVFILSVFISVFLIIGDLLNGFSGSEG